MSTIWSNSLNTGESVIDMQHKCLFELIERYFEACRLTNNIKVILCLLETLELRAVEHFSYEESIQKYYNYPGYKRHVRLHNNFRNMLKSIKNNIRVEELSSKIVQRSNSELFKWLYSHIRNEDRNLGIFLQKLRLPA